MYSNNTSYFDTSVSEDMNNLTDKVLINVMLKWHDIQENQEIMDGLRMDKNTMCIYFKNQNPLLDDSYIQARVLTFLLMMILSITKSIQNISVDLITNPK